MMTQFDEKRYGLVTASRCSPLVPKRDAKAGMVTLAKQLAQEMFFRFRDDNSGTWQTEHGNLGEEFALAHYHQYYDSEIKKGRFIFNGEIGGTTDAETLTYGVDFKCPTSLEKWLDYIYEGIDSSQYNQCQLYMRLTGFDTWKICAFLLETTRMSDNGDVYPIPYEKRMVIIDVKADKEWNEKFDSNLPEVIRMRDEYFELLKQKFS